MALGTLCQAAGQRNHRPACETQLDPSVIPGAGWEQRGEQQSEVWPEGVVRSIQPGGSWRKKKGRMRMELLAPVPGVGSRGGQVGCLGCVWEPGCVREGSRLVNALITMYCGAAVLTALWHLCSGKRINLYLY